MKVKYELAFISGYVKKPSGEEVFCRTQKEMDEAIAKYYPEVNLKVENFLEEAEK